MTTPITQRENVVDLRVDGATDLSSVEVPFLDLQAQYRAIRDDVVEAVVAVADSTAYILGHEVEQFERDFAAFVGVDHCVAVNSGTSALHLALIAAGVGYGHEVITVPMTFIATTWAISYVGATPVFVDVDPDTCTMDVEQVEAAITDNTRAIVPVHLYGQTADMDPLLEIAERHGIPVVEDAAQAHGARYGDRSAGSMGIVGCFSFYPGKNLGAAGEAGAITTNDADLAERMRALRDHAQGSKYHHTELGFNYRMDAMQGAVLGVKLRHLDGWIGDRRKHAQRYQNLLDHLPIRLPHEDEQRRSVWHLYVVRHPDRDGIRERMQEAGVATGLHYPVPVHLQGAYAHLGHSAGEFPVSESIASECLSLPMYPEMTETQQEAVALALAEALAHR